jgi:predicted Zn-dependent protease
VIRRFFARLLARLTTRRGALRFAAALVALALLAPQAWAWYCLRSAHAALAKYDPPAARKSLAACERVWGWRPSVRLLACRAAWQDGDVKAALAELRAAQRLAGAATDETAFEWALVQASGGNVGEVEEYLQRRAPSGAGAGPVAWEALALGYLRLYRTLDAMTCLNQWLKFDPDNVRALELRGQTYVAGKGVVRGTEDYRRAVELDPSRSATRLRLADGLIALGAYDEAAAHLERLAAEGRDDPGVDARLARCYAMLGRGDEARRLVEGALARHPDDPLAVRTLGQIDLISRHTAEAEQTLRRAVALAPDDYQAQQLLFQALQQQGKLEEAKAQLAVSEAVRERAARIGELTSRKLAEFPLDPAVHYEMGKLLVETGRPEIGERWLLTALSLDPDHAPSHAALAEYYQRRGDRAKADYHRARAAGPKQ